MDDYMKYYYDYEIELTQIQMAIFYCIIGELLEEEFLNLSHFFVIHFIIVIYLFVCYYFKDSLFY